METYKDIDLPQGRFVWQIKECGEVGYQTLKAGNDGIINRRFCFVTHKIYNKPVYPVYRLSHAHSINCS